MGMTMTVASAPGSFQDDGHVFPSGVTWANWLLGEISLQVRSSPTALELSWCVRAAAPQLLGPCISAGTRGRIISGFAFLMHSLCSERLKARKCFVEQKPKQAAMQNAPPVSKYFIYFVIKQ